MGLLFDGSETDPKNLEEVIHQALGAASMCWDNVEGEFKSDEAKEIAEEVISWINANYKTRKWTTREL